MQPLSYMVPTPQMTSGKPLVLASTSPYRRALLEKLRLPFKCVSPDADERPVSGETVEQMVVRLAQLKATSVAADHPDALIIGSDQSAELNGTILSKPGNRENARRQLQASSGQTITFHTGLCLLNTASGAMQSLCEPYSVVFRDLDDGFIDRYLDAEQPYDSVGSFRSEGLGISLFERFEGDDPNTLIGLPLIRLQQMLRAEGIDIL